MECIRVVGGIPLEGELEVSGAKNSVLPILASTLLFQGETVIENCPHLSDVESALDILRYLGCTVERQADTVAVNSRHVRVNQLTKKQMSAMRSTVLFAGPLLARTGRCGFYQPGGCCLGDRPIDLHLLGFRALGAEVTTEGEGLTCCGILKGSTVVLPFPSVGATENLIMAALGAQGVTTLCNAAREPEIADLITFLQKGGARIYGSGTSTLTIYGGLPNSAAHRVMADRMEAATFLAAGAATGGDVTMAGIDPGLLEPVLMCFSKGGCGIDCAPGRIRLRAPSRLSAGGVITTAPYPGFPTDAQAVCMGAFLRGRGVTAFRERIFKERFRHVPAFRALGGRIELAGELAVVHGVCQTWGCAMEATDLRGGAAMVVAALGAEDESYITKVEHIHRGYAGFTRRLCALGADCMLIDR